MTLHRVVVTGMACVTPLGNDLASSWESLLAGHSGAGPITQFDSTDFATHFACEVKGFDAGAYMNPKEARRMDQFVQYAVASAAMLLEQTGLKITPENAGRIGTAVGVGLGGMHSIHSNIVKLHEGGPKKINPFFIPVIIGNMAAGMVSIATGAKGPTVCTTTACASGLHALGYAYTDLMLGRADAYLCGGSESGVTEVGVGGFNAMKALSTRNDEPQRASRPFDKDRDGFVIGEGAGLVMLESLEHAQARGATIYAEIAGFGASGDAFHMAAPPENGEGMARSMVAALAEAKVSPADIQHVNCHATSTPAGDMCEIRALRTVFGDHADKLVLTANKSQIGHMLGAAGAVESIITLQSLITGLVPPTINLENPDPEMDLDCVTGQARKMDISHALCNSFGFGGTNASMIFKKFEA